MLPGRRCPKKAYSSAMPDTITRARPATRRVASRMAMMSPAPQNRSHAVSSSMCGILS